jgi:hypothetical protein
MPNDEPLLVIQSTPVPLNATRKTPPEVVYLYEPPE